MRGIANWLICLALTLVIWIVFYYYHIIGIQDETKFGKRHMKSQQAFT